METRPISGEYVAPEINVIELKNQGVLCASGNTENYEEGAWTW